MGIIELFLLAVGLSMDAFAVSTCLGLTMAKASLKKALIVGLYFGLFHIGMPLIGFLTATLFADKIVAYDHWIAFALLCFLGGKMMIGSFKKEEGFKNETSLKPATMLPLAVATSIDVLAVGVSFAFLRVAIIPAFTFIGVTTFVISMVGVKFGSVFGLRFKSKSELIGGAILVLIGVKILLEHLGVIA